MGELRTYLNICKLGYKRLFTNSDLVNFWG